MQPFIGQPMIEQANMAEPIAQPMAGYHMVPQPMIPYVVEVVTPHSTLPMILQAPYPNIVKPDTQHEKTSGPPYNLDSQDMQSELKRGPISGSCAVSCLFQAIPLRHLSIIFRSLSEYGKVIEEGPDKLVIRFKHRNPELMQQVIRHAWVTQYVGFGVQCRMHCGPLIQYKTIEMTLERVTNMTPSTSDYSTPAENTPLTSEVSTEDGYLDVTASESGDKGGENGEYHPNINYDYFGEYQTQFTRCNIVVGVPLPPQPVYPINLPQQNDGAYENQVTHIGCQGHQEYLVQPTHQGYQAHQGRGHQGHPVSTNHHHHTHDYQGYEKPQRFPGPRSHAHHGNHEFQGPPMHPGYQDNHGFQGYPPNPSYQNTQVGQYNQQFQGNPAQQYQQGNHGGWNNQGYSTPQSRHQHSFSQGNAGLSTPEDYHRRYRNQRGKRFSTPPHNRNNHHDQGNASFSTPRGHQSRYTDQRNESFSTPRGYQNNHNDQGNTSFPTPPGYYNSPGNPNYSTPPGYRGRYSQPNDCFSTPRSYQGGYDNQCNEEVSSPRSYQGNPGPFQIRGHHTYSSPRNEGVSSPRGCQNNRSGQSNISVAIPLAYQKKNDNKFNKDNSTPQKRQEKSKNQGSDNQAAPQEKMKRKNQVGEGTNKPRNRRMNRRAGYRGNRGRGGGNESGVQNPGLAAGVAADTGVSLPGGVARETKRSREHVEEDEVVGKADGDKKSR
ncbi:uncharacterized protein GGS22DRAFT_195011 [Annulohypoxylon maeteangense]|uniref:uncharacterized protein n=1 Tax=Annulohypoxylon maeteangense TaxID=1927788 RepID=UPI00200799FA|nr:uncharacterized protein GGS22DRAFT_195011 [Annulohypoxylon maeteangense]KAI0883791.1 hypothetical protein GGS22DRAFT_195011 [Annulohypoxylon maeteangense]